MNPLTFHVQLRVSDVMKLLMGEKLVWDVRGEKRGAGVRLSVEGPSHVEPADGRAIAAHSLERAMREEAERALSAEEETSE